MIEIKVNDGSENVLSNDAHYHFQEILIRREIMDDYEAKHKKLKLKLIDAR